MSSTLSFSRWLLLLLLLFGGGGGGGGGGCWFRFLTPQQQCYHVSDAFVIRIPTTTTTTTQQMMMMKQPFAIRMDDSSRQRAQQQHSTRSCLFLHNITLDTTSSTSTNTNNNDTDDTMTFEATTTATTRKKQQAVATATTTVSSPIPVMPSPLFQQLALSQLELLASAVVLENDNDNNNDDNNDNHDNNDDTDDKQKKNAKNYHSSRSSRSTTSVRSSSKIKSMALYLPQENCVTGQLEFLPAVLFPSNERVFIANDAATGMPPTLPRTLTKLPGFAHAQTLIPTYPMVQTVYNTNNNQNKERKVNSHQNQQQQNANQQEDDNAVVVGMVEEVLCDVQRGSGAALSVPLFCGSQTVGVLLVSPVSMHRNNNKNNKNKKQPFWTEQDRQQVARAAKSLSLALSMDNERTALQVKANSVQESLSDTLHQFKNPLQALRTFGKLLQQRIADNDSNNNNHKNSVPQLLELTEHLMVQSDRLVERLKPVDAIVESLGEKRQPPLAALNPATPPTSTSSSTASLVRWNDKSFLPWEQEALEFARNENIPNQKQTKDRNEKQAASVYRNDTTIFDVVSKQHYNHNDNDNENVMVQTNIVNNKNKKGDVYVRESNQIKSKASSRVTTTTTTTTTRAITRNENNSNLQSSSSSSRSSSSNNSMLSSLIGGGDVNNGDMDLQMSFVTDVLDPIFATFRAIAPDRGIQFSVQGGDEDDDLPGVTICPKALQEAITNVLDNAFQYVVLPKLTSSSTTTESNDSEQQQQRTSNHNPSPRVRVRLFANTKPTAPGVTILVEDNGPGIPPDERTRVLERGVRSSITASSTEGSGIGLDIAHTLVREMGGILRIVDPAEYSDAMDGAIVQLTLFRRRLNRK